MTFWSEFNRRKGGYAMVKRCLFCGRYFTPDYRVKDRQKSCRRPECRKARKKIAQVAWVNKNPLYFADLYETYVLSLIHISEPTRLGMISYAVFCLKKKK